MGIETVYLDNNATTRPSEGVVAAMVAAGVEFWENPSSMHRRGQGARARVELAREQVARLVGGRAREITFTSGGTESIDLAIRGVVGVARARGAKARVVTLRIEHSAVRDLAAELEASGAAEVAYARVGVSGVVEASEIDGAIGEAGATLVSVQWANNETGAIQPVREIAEVCRRRGVLFHCDGVQWVGKEPVAEQEEAGVTHRQSAQVAPPCDLLSFSAHKFHGPKGVGALWVRTGVKLKPTLIGTQELGRRGGTENVAGIVGMGLAAEEAERWLADGEARRALAGVRDRFERLVLEACPGAVVNGDPSRRLWNTTNIGFPALEAEALLLMLSERGVCASAGAACSSGSLEPSPVLLAMGIEPRIAHGSLRFSLSKDTTMEAVERSAGIVIGAVKKLSQSMP